MATAYNPGLMVTERILFTKERRLPLKGTVLVKEGQHVVSGDIAARTELPGNVVMVNVANKFNVPPGDVRACMVKKEGQQIEKDEVIAATTSFFGLFKYAIKSPIAGTVENISDVTGQVFLREAPIPVEVFSYIDGVVSQVIEGEGADIQTHATYIQGIFGIGGEEVAPLAMACKKPSEILDETKIKQEHKGKIVVGGSLVTSKAIDKAIKTGVRGIIVGGLDDQDLKNFLGYDLGVAITGTEQKGLTLVVTEGFGEISMAEKTFHLLNKYEGKKASINGATQIRAGVIRPEIIIPQPEKDETADQTSGDVGLGKGTPVRIIREPNFGKLGSVIGLPVQLQAMESETKVRVAEVKFSDGTKALVPRANIEIIES